MNFTESFKKNLKEAEEATEKYKKELDKYLSDKFGSNYTMEDNVNGLTDKEEIFDSIIETYIEEGSDGEMSFIEYLDSVINGPHGLVEVKALKESDNAMKDKFIEFKRQVYSDFEQFEEDMMNDDTDVFSGTEDSYANEMIWEHLSDTVYYLLEDKFDTDEAYRLTDIFTSKLIDAYNENRLDDEIGKIFATYMNGLKESEFLKDRPLKTVDQAEDTKKKIQEAIKKFGLKQKDLDRITTGNMDKICNYADCDMLDLMYYLRYGKLHDEFMAS